MSALFSLLNDPSSRSRGSAAKHKLCFTKVFIFFFFCAFVFQMLFLATFFPTWEGGAGVYDFVGVSVRTPETFLTLSPIL